MARIPFPRRSLTLLRAAALAAVLLFAQTAAIAHSELADSHPAGEVCTLCVGLATLGSGAASTPPQVCVVVHELAAVGYAHVPRLERRVERPFARGPPRVS